MKLGVRSRLFLFSLVAILLAIATGGLYLRHELRSQLEADIESELLHHARSAREMLVSLAPQETIEALDPLADRIGRATTARVTVIARDGRVLGDSRLSVAEVREIENHGNRPEIKRALSTGRGISRRYSTTLKREMVYMAVQLPRGRGVVRVAMSLDRVDDAVGRLHLMLFVAAILAMGIAVILSAVGSHAFAVTLERLVQRVRSLTERTDGPTDTGAEDDLGGLIGSIARMSNQLETMVSHLAHERDRFQAVIESLGEGVLALDHDRRVTHVNGAAIEILRLKERPLGKTLLETVRIPALHELIDRAENDSPATLEIDLHADPDRRLLARATRQSAGGFVLVLHDLTALRRLETIRKDFVANVSHELRTPVSVILANTETLLDGAIDDRTRAVEFIEALRRSATRLSTLISDLMELSRIDAGKRPLDLERVDLSMVIQKTLESLGPAATEKNQRLRDEAKRGLAVIADEGALRQVVLNLVENAVKYTQEGGEITISSRTTNGRVRLEVRDNGPGIERRHQERLFERFYRVDTGRSREMGGTGLGLAIVKNLVESMGGEVGVEGSPPRGSVFWVTLPAAE
jgi:two-component system phosphate regulon sensor histidine kinase PhoR